MFKVSAACASVFSRDLALNYFPFPFNVTLQCLQIEKEEYCLSTLNLCTSWCKVLLDDVFNLYSLRCFERFRIGLCKIKEHEKETYSKTSLEALMIVLIGSWAAPSMWRLIYSVKRSWVIPLLPPHCLTLSQDICSELQKHRSIEPKWLHQDHRQHLPQPQQILR